MGPLHGIKVIELGGIGPGPFGCMLLADLGAEVIRLERVVSGFKLDEGRDPKYNIWNRGRRSIQVDLRQPQGVDIAKRLIATADAVVEGFRPGVMERIGLGPDECLALNPRLIYGRMTGWGQNGPLAQVAGHDINYIALTGALAAIGRPDEAPVAPLNLVGDLGGGGTMLALGIVSALVERATSGRGQIVDAAIVDGVATMMSLFHGLNAAGDWSDIRGGNMVDGGLPWYDVYETSDGLHVSIGALEPQFYANLLARLGMEDEDDLPDRADAAGWPELRGWLEALFKTRTRSEWCEILEGSDTCFAPVLSLSEAPSHPHLVARGTYINVEGVEQPRPAPRFSRTNHEVAVPPPAPGKDTDDLLREIGFADADIASLRLSQSVA